MKTLLSWSSGKDSAWSLHTLRSDPRYEVVGLVTTINAAANRVAMHAVRTELLRDVAIDSHPPHGIDVARTRPEAEPVERVQRTLRAGHVTHCFHRCFFQGLTLAMLG